MSRVSAATLVAIPVLGLICLTACTTAQPETVDETYISGPDVPAEEPVVVVTPNPIEPDTTLIVRSTATAPNGAQLDLELQVHRSVRWDDVASQTLPAAILLDCASLYTGALFAEEQWSFTRVNLTAIARDGSAEWPADAQILARPSGEFVPVAGRGDFLAAGTASTPLCQRDKYLDGAGRAGMAMGLPEDGPALTAWAQHQFGMTVVGATLDECTAEVTALGQEAGAGTGAWTTISDATTCVAGPPEDSSVF